LNTKFIVKNEIYLNKGRDKNIFYKHPWVFSGALQRLKGDIKNGEPIFVKSFDNKLLGIGSFSSRSQISIRMWTFGEEEFTENYFLKKISDAYLRKLSSIGDKSDSFRVVFGESDGVPGLILDKYADYCVCQFLSAGVDYFKDEIIKAIISVIKPVSIYERSDNEIRSKEGLNTVKQVLYGKEPNELIKIFENGVYYLVDVINGHKTGYYLDQRDNRAELLSFCNDKDVFNCFSYTGGFGIFALKGGAKSLVNVETSESANNIAAENIKLNNLDLNRVTFEQEDAFRLLRKYRDMNKQFDVIVLDPPKFAESVSQVAKASKGYKDINLLAMKLLRKNGVLFTFSCSGHISGETFHQIISSAAFDSGREVRIVKFLTQACDHPILTSFPESQYLKGLVCIVS